MDMTGKYCKFSDNGVKWDYGICKRELPQSDGRVFYVGEGGIIYQYCELVTEKDN